MYGGGHGRHHHHQPIHLQVLHQKQRPSFWKQFAVILVIELIFVSIMLLVLMRHMGSSPVPYISHY